MFDPLAFASVALVAGSGTAGALVLAAVAAVILYRPGSGRRRKETATNREG